MFKPFALLESVWNLLKITYNITYLTLGRLLHYLGKLKKIADIEENTNKVHFKCTDFNFSMLEAVYAECIYVLTEYIKYLAYKG